MNTLGRLAGVSVLVCAAMAVGCTKKVNVTIYNHTTSSLGISLTVPDGTLTVGSVGAGSRLTHTLAVKTSDLPAQCTYSAGPGSSLSFTVDEDTKSKLWFHITRSGRLTGPYGKDDVHVETEKRGKINVKVRTEPVIR